MKLQLMQESFINQLKYFEADDTFLAQLKPTGSLLPEQQLAIYQNNVRGALQSCLAQVYPVCQKILGEPYFKQLARGYIKTTPSNHADLNCYGGSFSDYILSQCQQKKELYDFPYLSDLAQLEWLYHRVYFAANAPEFDFSAFAELTPLQQTYCIFEKAPCLEFMPSDYPILSIWKLNQTASSSQEILPKQTESCCVFRRNNKIELFLVESQIWNLLSLIEADATLDQIVQANLDHLLPELIKQGWIGGFKVMDV